VHQLPNDNQIKPIYVGKRKNKQIKNSTSSKHDFIVLFLFIKVTPKCLSSPRGGGLSESTIMLAACLFYPLLFAVTSCCSFGYKTNTNDIIRTKNRMAT